MKKIKIRVWRSTGYSGCTVEDVLDVELDGDETQEKINDICQEHFNLWSQNFDEGWSIQGEGGENGD